MKFVIGDNLPGKGRTTEVATWYCQRNVYGGNQPGSGHNVLFLITLLADSH